MPHRLSVDEPNSDGRATSRSRAPLLTQVLVQGSFLLLTYQCTSDLYYPLLFSCTSEWSSEHSCLFCCTSEFEYLVRTTFPHLYYYYPRINRLRPNFQTTVAKVYQSTVFLGCARRGQRAVGDPSTTGLCVYV